MRHSLTLALAAAAMFALLSGSASAQSFEGRKKCSSCHKTARIKFDLRRHHRINTHIPGRIFHTHTEEETKDIIILSLSVGGVGFTINNDLAIKTDDMYTIKFQLDDKYSSVICEEITIKHVDGRWVSAEFYQSDWYNHELDFYIAGIL